MVGISDGAESPYQHDGIFLTVGAESVSSINTGNATISKFDFDDIKYQI
jgi:hypothetical protein